MPVNPDEMLIFKLRAEQVKKKQAPKAAPAKAVQQPQPMPKEAPQQQAQPQPQPQAQPAPPAQPPTPTSTQQAELQAVEQKVKAGFWRPGKMRAPGKRVTLQGEEFRALELGKIQQGIYEEQIAPQRKRAAPRLGTHVFAPFVAALMILATSAIFGYYVYPQLGFTAKYMVSVGVTAFFSTLNLTYDFTFVNALLIVFMFLGGLRLLTSSEKRFGFAGTISGLLILAVAIEYFNTSAQYLLWILLLGFASVGLIAYATMSYEGAQAERLSGLEWPIVETY